MNFFETPQSVLDAKFTLKMLLRGEMIGYSIQTADIKDYCYSIPTADK